MRIAEFSFMKQIILYKNALQKPNFSTNFSSTWGDWRRWLARLLDMQEVTGSSPVSPTELYRNIL